MFFCYSCIQVLQGEEPKLSQPTPADQVVNVNAGESSSSGTQVDIFINSV